jgi:hypothetical protein
VSDQALLDYVAICRLQAAYADAVTRRAWTELDQLFLSDAPVEVDTVTNTPIAVVGAAGIGGFISTAIERFEFFELVILNVHVVGDADERSSTQPGELRSRSFTCELRQESANGHWTNAFGVYHDNLRRVGGTWRYARRRYQSLARTGRSEVFPFPQPVGFE